MKKNLLFIFTILFFQDIQSQTFKSVYDQLLYVNTQWHYIDGMDALKSQPPEQLNETELIQFHLQQTELLLRNKIVTGLTDEQRRNREINFDHLHEYWQKGIFPINDKHFNRQPYFIDNNDTYCAVGYLMKTSGGDGIARQIQQTQNYSYLFDINQLGLMEWAQQSGLTLNELALIQPGYPGDRGATVTEMHYNNTGDDLHEYLEFAQPHGFGSVTIKKIFFYDNSGNLYKTLDIPVDLLYDNAVFFYEFPVNEHFADKGKIELVGDYFSIVGAEVSQIIIYSDTSIDRIDSLFPGPTPVGFTHHYSIGENEITQPGTSITFCGFNGGNPQVLPATIGAVNPCTLLPLNLLQFDYHLIQKKVKLEWRVAPGDNTNFFEIERSPNGKDFSVIGKIAVAGNKYSFTDNLPGYINHYRLKQVDKDGKITYSKLLYVRVPDANPLILSQKFVKGQLSLQVSIDNPASLILYDLTGREVKRFKAVKGFQNLDISFLPGGKYFIRLVDSGGGVYNQTFIKE